MNAKPRHLKDYYEDTDTGEIICSCGCAYVISDNTVDLSHPDPMQKLADNKLGHHNTESSKFHDKSLGSVLAKTGKDHKGEKVRVNQRYMNKLNTQSRINTNSDRRLVRYFSVMAEIKDELHMSKTVFNSTLYWIRKAESRGILKSKAVRTVCLVITLLASRECGIIINAKKLRKLQNGKRKNRYAQFFQFTEEFKNVLNITDNTGDNRKGLLGFMCNEYSVTSEVYNKCMEILKYAEKKGSLRGMRDRTAAIAILIVVSRNIGKYPLPIIDVVSEMKVGEDSVRECMRNLIDVFGAFDMTIRVRGKSNLEIRDFTGGNR